VRLYVGSRNPHKLRELSALLPGHALEPVPAGVELGPETGTTFAENAALKARRAAAATGALALGDDSGIEAVALDGAPGVLSARYAGPGADDADNLAKLLRAVPPDGDRRARFVCALVLAAPDGREWTFEGRCDGTLATEARGAGGFGYDPAFVPLEDPSGRTMAELSAEEKDRISHRGRAARMVAAWLDDHEGQWD
jgi:XTP/dITP diphosphohydrolase